LTQLNKSSSPQDWLGAFFFMKPETTPPQVAKPTLKVNFYIDGCNLHQGLIEYGWESFLWLDFVEFCKKLIGKYSDWELQKVKYYSARPFGILGLQKNMLINANKHKNADKFEEIQGKYIIKTLDCDAKCKLEFKIAEEKCTDVGIAVDMVADCIKGNCQVSVLISGDNDQIPNLRYIKTYHSSHKLLVFFPPNRHKNELGAYCFKAINLTSTKSLFENSLLDDKIIISPTAFYMRPPEWPSHNIQGK